LPTVPETLTWSDAPTLTRRYDEIDLMRDWTVFFRRSYREAREAVQPDRTAAETADHGGEPHA
jgi:hypothetical protein